MSPPRPTEHAERARTHLLLFLLTLKAHRTSECGCWVVCVHRPVLLLLGDLVATMPGLCVWVHVRHMPHAVAAVVPAHGLQRLAAEQPWLVAACYIWWFDFAAVSAYECTVMGTIRVMWVLHFAVAQHAQVRVLPNTHGTAHRRCNFLQLLVLYRQPFLLHIFKCVACQLALVGSVLGTARVQAVCVVLCLRNLLMSGGAAVPGQESVWFITLP